MGRQVVKRKNKITLKAGIFWGAIALVTVSFIIGIIIVWSQNSRISTSYDDLQQLEGREIFEQSPFEDGTYSYYVFIYGSDDNQVYSSRVDDLESSVANYITFYNHNSSNSNVLNIYGFDIDRPANEGKVGSNTNVDTANFANFSISREDAPMLIRVEITVSGGTRSAIVKYSWTTESIKSVLQNSIDNITDAN